MDHACRFHHQVDEPVALILKLTTLSLSERACMILQGAIRVTKTYVRRL